MSSKMSNFQPVSSGLASESWCFTERKSKKFSFKWKIENFLDSPEEKGECLESSTFPADSEYRFRLQIYPRDEHGHSEIKDNVPVHLVLVSSKTNPVYAKCKLSILDVNKKESNVHDSDALFEFHVGQVERGWSTFVRRQKLSDTANGFLCDDNLIMYCVVEVLEDPVTVSNHTYPVGVPDKYLSNGILFKENSKCDSAFSGAHDQDLPATESWCHTERKLDKVSFKWGIDNFMKCPEEKGKFLLSSTFSAGKRKWKLEIYPRGETRGVSEDNVSLYLVLASSKAPWVYAKSRLCILDTEGKERNIMKYGMRKHLTALGWPCFISRKTLSDEDNGLLHNGRLWIYCEVEALTDPVTTSGHQCTNWVITPEAPYKILTNSLPHDFGSLLESRIMSDVVLTSAEEHEFPAHKLILSARSPVFAAMFKHNTKENLENKVEIVDMAKEVIRGMLQYVYTDKVSKIQDIVKDLLAAADKYGLDGLKLMCEQQLITMLSVDTAVEFLILAHAHKADHLKSKVAVFLKMAAKDVVETDGWKVLIKEHPNLLAEIMKAPEVSAPLLLSMRASLKSFFLYKMKKIFS